MYLYLLLNVFTISLPLAFSFESKVSYYKKWRFLFPAILLTGTFFIVWDHWFTNLGVWSFNNQYILGIRIFELPLEEWLFFLTVPFACIFIYESLKYHLQNNPFDKIAGVLTLVLIIILTTLGLLHLDKLYTSVNFLLTALMLSVHWLIFKSRYLGMFYLTYLVHLIPFGLVNGVLTYQPVVIYNNAENLGIRIVSIPVEDAVYSLFLLLMNISFYEYFMLKYEKQRHYSLG